MTSFARRLSSIFVFRRAKEAAAMSAASRDETTRKSNVYRWYVFYSTISMVRLTTSRRLHSVHSDEDAFAASSFSLLALASANAFFFAEDTLGITAPGFFFASGSSYLLFR